MLKKILSMFIFFFSLTVCYNAFAVDAYCGENVDKVINTLNVNDEQRAQINSVLSQLQTTLQNKSNKMGELKKEISQSLMEEPINKSKINGLISKRTELAHAIYEAKILAKIQILNTLNPAQKAKLHDMVKKVDAKKEEHMHHCHNVAGLF